MKQIALLSFLCLVSIPVSRASTEQSSMEREILRRVYHIREMGEIEWSKRLHEEKQRIEKQEENAHMTSREAGEVLSKS